MEPTSRPGGIYFESESWKINRTVPDTCIAKGQGTAVNTTRIRKLTRRLAALPRDRAANFAADADLLTRFLISHDEAAFGSLVDRHMPAVRAVCRSVLRDPNDAEDATQATFLVLVRRADAVRNRLAIGGWLCRVAWRTANRLREMNARRVSRQVPDFDPDLVAAKAPAPHDRSEIAAALNEEIHRLPEQYRIAVLTCYEAGTPTAEAAIRLGWPKGTLLTRLAWARKRLRDRLAKRGLSLSGGFAAIFATRTGTASGAILAGRIVASAAAIASGDPTANELVSERVSSLMEGVVRAMVGTKIKLIVGIGFLAIALLGLGLGRMTAGPADAADKKLVTGVVAPPAKAAEPRDAVPAKPPTPDLDLPKVEFAPAGPGNDLVVRRPLGSFTREVAPFGKATFTFTENRLHIQATVNIEKVNMTVSLDADYSMNRESVVYGVINGADITGAGEVGAAVGPYAAIANDLPFSFRVRVEDDAITIKDLKVGMLGSPLLAEVFGKGADVKEMQIVASMIGGKYKADPNADRNLITAPRKK